MYNESQNIYSFFTQVIGLVTQVRSHGETAEDRRIVEKILRSFPSRFDPIVVNPIVVTTEGTKYL